MPEIEIARTGVFTDASGITKSFTPEFLQEVAGSYNPKIFKAPLIISHKTNGIEDSKLADSELAFGAPSKLKVVGDRLKAVFKKVSPKIVDHFRNGELLSISPSFYPPTNRNNPLVQMGGKKAWTLRHIAALGIQPPSIKNLETPSFSEKGYDPTEDTLNFSFPVDLNDDGETLEFSIGSYSVRSLFSNLRDWLIERHGKEETEKILPREAIAEIAMSDRYHSEEINRLVREIDDLKSEAASQRSEVARDPPPTMMYKEEENRVDLKEHKGKPMKTKHKNSKPPVDDFEMDDEEELEEEMEESTVEAVSQENKKKKKKKTDYAENTLNYAEELAEERRQRRLLELQVRAVQDKARADRARQKEKDITNFCEELVKDGKLTAAQTGDRLLEFGEGEESEQTLPQFMMSLDDEQLSFMEDFLSTSPQIIDYGEFAPDNKQVDRNGIRDFSAPDGFAVSDDSADLYNKVAEYAENHGLDITDPDQLGKAYDAVN